MAEVLFQSAESKLPICERLDANRPSSLVRSLSFKYYIHDSVSTLRFQIIGDLRAGNVVELNGSWETARTTLDLRQFVLDVSQLYSADEDGLAWLERMRESGAAFLPADYRDVASRMVGGQTPEQVAAVKLSLLGRVMGLLRG